MRTFMGSEEEHKEEKRKEHGSMKKSKPNVQLMWNKIHEIGKIYERYKGVKHEGGRLVKR